MKNMIVLFCILFVSSCASTNVVKPTKDLFAMRDQAAGFYQKGQYQEALEVYEGLVGAVPEDAELWFKKGNTHAQLLQPELAVESYQQAVLREPKKYKAWRNMSVIHLRQAANSLTQLMEVLPPDHPLYQSSLDLTQATLRLLNKKNKKSQNNQ